MYCLDDWIQPLYDGVVSYVKPSRQSIFDIKVNDYDLIDCSYIQSLYTNAEALRDSFSEPFDVFLSGGTDSEIVVRIFKDLGIKHNTFTFVFNDNLNVQDVIKAECLCDSLNIKLNLIDVDLEKFARTEAINVFEKTFIPLFLDLFRYVQFSYCDNIPIICEGEPYWRLKDKRTFTKQWRFVLTERELLVVSILNSIFGKRPIIPFYLFTPWPITTYYNEVRVKQMFNHVYNLSDSWPLRFRMFHEHWLGHQRNLKMVGLERSNISSFNSKSRTEWPSYITEIEDYCLKQTNMKELEYTLSQFEQMFLERRIRKIDSVR